MEPLHEMCIVNSSQAYMKRLMDYLKLIQMVNSNTYAVFTKCPMLQTVSLTASTVPNILSHNCL